MVAIVGGAWTRSEGTDTYGLMNVYVEAVSLIHERYVDHVSWDKLARDGIRGLVGDLGGDSELLSPQQYRARRTRARRADGGIGVALTVRDHTITVASAIDGMPAARAGVEPGDEILTIDGVNVVGWEPVDVDERLQGAPGTPVALSIVRAGWAEPRSVTVTRVHAAGPSVSSREVAAGILHVRIHELTGATALELRHALENAPARAVKGLILDLRDSSGRNLPIAAEIAGLLVEKGSAVAQVRGRRSGLPGDLKTFTQPEFPRLPVVVLVDRGTLSASEVLAGALQDLRRAVLVGTTTFGDASVQSLIPLSDGSALSLTTARYLTPTGRTIDGSGIVPDVVVARRESPPPAVGKAPTASSSDPQLDVAVDIVRAALILERGGATGTGTVAGGSATRRRTSQSPCSTLSPCGPPAS